MHVAGLSTRMITSHQALDACIEDGTSHRTVASTKYNSESSRRCIDRAAWRYGSSRTCKQGRLPTRF